MTGAHAYYQHVAEAMVRDHTGIVHGVMMRSPAVKTKGKVFAFFYEEKDAMCFKLGKEFAIESHGIRDYEFLNPFKNKPPMTGWYVVSEQHVDRWLELAEIAFELMIS